MAMFIGCQQEDGELVQVNLDLVLKIKEQKGGTQITFVNGERLRVTVAAAKLAELGSRRD